MKRIVLLGSDKNLEKKLINKINRKGYSVKQINNMEKLNNLLNRLSPDFVLCSGTIKIDSEGIYYLEF